MIAPAATEVTEVVGMEALADANGVSIMHYSTKAPRT
jgi:hypothetical protein